MPTASREFDRRVRRLRLWYLSKTLDSPYRSAENPAETPAPSVVDELSVLGPLRSSHVPGALQSALLPAALIIAISVAVASGAESACGPAAYVVVLPAALVAFLLLAWSRHRIRHLRVDLHLNGVVVSNSGTRTVIAFDDVDEVWMVHEPTQAWNSTIMRIRELRVVERSGLRHRIPTNVTGGGEIREAVVRRCTNRLRGDAMRALREGETLTFGPIQIDRDGIRGPSWAARWQQLCLVRYASGQITLFRRQRFISWRSLSLDDVPHPTLFAQLVTDCAVNVVIDAPVGTVDY